MDPNSKVVQCILQVAGPADHTEAYLAVFGLVGITLIIAVGLVLWCWIEHWDKERNAELKHLRREVAHIARERFSYDEL